MTDQQWEQLLSIIGGELLSPIPTGFLIDGPWVCGVNNVRLMNYFSDRRTWLDANLQAVQRFPDVMWLPGFWAEYGMISNPPSFGAKCIWPEDALPTCERVLHNCSDIGRLQQPDVRSDGLLPFVMQRLRQCRPEIESAGHRIRFACSHGPITIASYLLGHNEFFLACRTEPAAIERLLEMTTCFVTDWLRYQKEELPSIDGILVLEDLMGFVGEQDFRGLVLPHMQQVFAAMPASVRFLHNDAFGLITAKYLSAMNVNLFNFSFEHDPQKVRRLAGDNVTLMGNIPPRDVLGMGTPDDVRQSVTDLLASVDDHRRLIVSAGGFTPGDFGAAKIEAFYGAVSACSPE